MTEKESIQNHFLLKVIKVLAQGLICNETESFQGLAYKNRKRFSSNYASPAGKTYFARRRFQKTIHLEMTERLTVGLACQV